MSVYLLPKKGRSSGAEGRRVKSVKLMPLSKYQSEPENFCPLPSALCLPQKNSPKFCPICANSSRRGGVNYAAS